LSGIAGFIQEISAKPGTFETMLEDVSKQLPLQESEKPVVVMDAGIATDENLAIIRSNKFNYDYVCVSRTMPKEYTKLSDNMVVTDNRGNKIELTKVSVRVKKTIFYT